MNSGTLDCQLNQTETEMLVEWCTGLHASSDNALGVAREVAKRLGAHWANGRTHIGFWAPEFAELQIASDRVFVEILRPLDPIDFDVAEQHCGFARQRIPLHPAGDYFWGVVDGMRPGTRAVVGDFYQLTFEDSDGAWRTVKDPLAHSLPFGAFAPAELYDIARMQAARSDATHFAERLDTAPDPDGVARVQPPLNILQIHVRTASPEGTLAGLTRIYERIGEKLREERPLTPAEETVVGYDAVQLMPIEPVIEFEAGPRLWQVEREADDGVTVTLQKPAMTNWGYDVIMLGSSATNPTVLGSRRPDELVDFIAALHNFPTGPIKVIFDIVFGHIDNQAIGLLNRHYFAGANMYGQNVNFLHPVVRANLLEMQRRKHNYGVDGVRVDGAQDFKNWDPETGTMWHDDAYLRLMNDLEQEVAGVRYRPWMIFEDGRPWPRDDWELASTYREVTKRMPNVWQWGPLTFAHNTPFLFTFWVSKFWRIWEMAHVGKQWITGCANHDTLRRGTQVPLDARINTYLGDSLPEIFRKAYNNPAAKLFDYAIMPGIPMDFINGSMEAPWSFVRNTDARYGVKVVSEESRFLHWVVDEAMLQSPEAFRRLKAHGFTDLVGLRRFLTTLDHAVQATQYDLDAIVALLNNLTPPLAGPTLTVELLKQIARDWMDDVHALCNVWQYADRLDGKETAFFRAVRAFRKARPFLLNNLQPNDTFDYLRPSNGSVIFYGMRHAPDGERVLFVANMEGAPRTVKPADLPIANFESDGWQLAITTPGLKAGSVTQPLTLHDSEAAVYTRPPS